MHLFPALAAGVVMLGLHLNGVAAGDCKPRETMGQKTEYPDFLWGICRTRTSTLRHVERGVYMCDTKAPCFVPPGKKSGHCVPIDKMSLDGKHQLADCTVDKPKKPKQGEKREMGFGEDGVVGQENKKARVWGEYTDPGAPVWRDPSPPNE